MDEEASSRFEDFFEREYPKLLRVLWLASGDRTEAEDLAQEAMARTFERWSSVKGKASPAGYVYKTAFNLNRSRLRRLRVRARRLVLESDQDEIAAAETRSDVREALRSLPTGQRDALILVGWLGLDSNEAGEILGIEAESVRSRVHRARSALRGLLGGYSG